MYSAINTSPALIRGGSVTLLKYDTGLSCLEREHFISSSVMLTASGSYLILPFSFSYCFCCCIFRDESLGRLKGGAGLIQTVTIKLNYTVESHQPCKAWRKKTQFILSQQQQRQKDGKKRISYL